MLCVPGVPRRVYLRRQQRRPGSRDGVGGGHGKRKGGNGWWWGNGRTEAGEKARGDAEEVKEAGRRDVVKDRAKKAGEDVKEAIKDAR